MKKSYFLILFLISIQGFSQPFSFTEWENEKVAELNKEPAHVTFIPYQNEFLALKDDCT